MGSSDGSGGSAEGEQAASLPPGQALQATRSIVYTGDMSLKVDDVSAAAARVVEIAEAAGGFLSEQELDPAPGEDVGTASIEIRVPADQFRAVVADVGRLGEVLSQSASADDVTDQVVDLQARLATARASLERVRALMGQAGTLAEVASLEHELTVRETIVEQLEGSLRVVQDQVALATLTARMGEEAPPPPPSSSDPKPNEHIPGFVQGLKQGWARFQDAVGVVLTAVGVALPFLLVVAPAAIALRWYRRWRPAA
jgi:hypothetical protein